MKNTRPVYSTDSGRLCPGCGNPQNACTCRNERPIKQGDGTARVRREVKGRKGKTVTTVSGIQLPNDRLKELASRMKRKLGTGGAVKNSIIEIQGDRCGDVLTFLKEEGFSVKRSGG